MKIQVEKSYIETNHIRLHIAQAGPQDGPLVLLLHGFPEFWYGWRNQIGPLAQAGFRVVAPDLRGYNLSDKPRAISAYRQDILARDVVGLINALGREKASLVGHDWGGVVGWAVAALFPEFLERMVILNAPYSPLAQRGLLRHPDQILRSSYVIFFQIPVLPEAILRNNNWEMVVEGMRRSSRPGVFRAADFDCYRQSWWQKDAFTSMLNWYRALLRYPAGLPDKPRIQTPTLILWGVKDSALNRAFADASLALCNHGRLVFFEDATHWVQHEEIGQVNELLVDFLSPAGR